VFELWYLGGVLLTRLTGGILWLKSKYTMHLFYQAKYEEAARELLQKGENSKELYLAIVVREGSKEYEQLLATKRNPIKAIGIEGTTFCIFMT